MTEKPADLPNIHGQAGLSDELNFMQKHYNYCDMRNVRLIGGTVFAENQEQMNAYLLSVDDDQMLYNFRRACGLDTKGAQPMTGWDAQDGKLRGHTTGHYLSALALAWAATGEERFREKAEYIVEGLAECQAAFDASDDYHPGFLSAYSEEQFDLLEDYTPYPQIWAPYYTLDKIMSGLYDAYSYLGNVKAMEIESKIGDWIYARLVRLSDEQRNKMWEMYIAGEYGGMIQTLVGLYRVTAKKEHLLAAKLFFNNRLFDPMEEGKDVLEEMHANQHIPQIIGALEIYRTTAEEKYFRIADHFWKIVTSGHTYMTGGTGESERFHARNSMTEYLTEKTQESCASYNMLRLTGLLLEVYRTREEDCEWALMDYYENTLINHIMTSCSHRPDGGTLYFLPVQPGARREILLEENSCCHGTGMESRYRFMEHIFGEDEDFIYVNLLVDSVLRDEKTGEILISIQGAETEHPEIEIHKNLARGLKIHVAEGEASSSGEASYCVETSCREIPGPICAGTKITLELPLRFSIVRCACNTKYAVLKYGKKILAGISDSTTYHPLPDIRKIKKDEKTGEISDGSMRFLPLQKVDDEAYHVYFSWENSN